MAPNASKMIKNHPFWVRTHFGYFKPWFGAIILLFYHSFWRLGTLDPLAPPSAPWRPPGPPGAPMTPGMSSWAIVSHPGSLLVIFDPSGVNNSSVSLELPPAYPQPQHVELRHIRFLTCSDDFFLKFCIPGPIWT